jgi:hypothetical protein
MEARNSEYGLIFSKGANFLVIRGKKTTDQRTIAGLLLEESKRTSPTGYIQTAYKKTSNGFVLYIEDAGYPYYLEDPANLPFMFQVPVPRKKLGSKADKKDGNGTTQTGDRLWFEKLIR